MAVTKVVMPKLSDAMESGKIIKWLKKEGDRIQGGDILAEVETDKADVEMEAFGAGVLRKVLVKEGDRVPVGALIAVIAEPNDDIASVVDSAPVAAPATSQRPAAVPPPPRGEDHATVAKQEPATKAPAAAAVVGRAQAEAPAPAAPASSTAGRIKVSPLARKVAAQSGVDLRLLHGSGPGGRIVRKDVEAAASAPAAAGAPAPRAYAAPVLT